MRGFRHESRGESVEWYQAVVRRATAICFIAGRLSFVQPDGARTGTAGAPSALLAFGLPCALALSESRLGQTLVLPGEMPPERS